MRTNRLGHAFLTVVTFFCLCEIVWAQHPGVDKAPALLIRQLGDDDDFVQEAAIKQLYEMGPKVIPSVVNALVDPNERRCEGAASVLRQFGAASVPFLKEFANGNDVRKHVAAIRVLGTLRSNATAVVPDLVKLTTHPDEKLRLAVIEALASIRDGRAIPPLLKMVREEKDDFIRQEALLSISLFGEMAKPYIPRIIEIGTSTSPRNSESLRGTAFAALSSLGALAVPDIVKLIESPTSTRASRRFAIRCIYDMVTWYPGGNEAKDAVPCLIRVLGEKDTILQVEASSALGQIGPPAKAAIATLEKSLKSLKPPESVDIAYDILKIDPLNQPAMAVLLELVRQAKNRDVRLKALDRLGCLTVNAAPAVPTVVRLLDDRDEAVRRLTCVVLGNVPKEGKIAIGNLRQLMVADPDASVRKAAQSALEALTTEDKR